MISNWISRNRPVLLLVISLIFYCREGAAQERVFDLELGKTTVSEVLNSIENKTDYYFLFNPTLIDIHRNVSFNLINITLDKALKELFKDTDIKYLIINKQIILSPGKYMKDLHLRNGPFTVSGKVMDKEGLPLPGATVLIKGTSTGTVTNKDGRYTIQVSDKDTVLKYSYVGYKQVTVGINGRNEINVKMEEDLHSLEEVLKIGYGTVRKTDLTGAVTTLSAEDLDMGILPDLSHSIQGKAPGLSVESLGGNPGMEMRMTIRGAGSLNSNQPLILIDEVPVNSLHLLNTSNIKSVQILKDASAAAIYGSRAANGVILVETKNGGDGKMQINANIDFGIQKLDKKMDLLNAEQWSMVNTLARKTDGLDSLDMVKDPEVSGRGTDWQEAMYENAPVKRIELTGFGGNETGKYKVNFGYLDQDGIVTRTRYNNINLQVKSEYVKGRLTLGENIILNREFRNNITDNGAGSGNAVQSAVIANPLFKIYLGKNESNSLEHPVGTQNNVLGLLNLLKNQNTIHRVLLSMYGNYEIHNNFTYRAIFSTRSEFSHYLNQRSDYMKQNIYAMGREQLNKPSHLLENSTTLTFWQLEQTLTYKAEFGMHRINAVAGQTSQKNHDQNIGADVYGLPNNLSVLNAGNQDPGNYGARNESTLLSYFGRMIYSYDQRYSLTATLRRDGSSRFSDKFRWGNFPSVAIAWNIGNEDFFHPRAKTISTLKLRASYGVLGNQEIGNYQYIGLITPSFVTTVGNPARVWMGSIQTDYPASDIKWESTQTGNLGLDLTMWSGKLEFTADYYYKNTTDLLLRIPIPLSTGVSTFPYSNDGRIINKGLELMLSYNAAAGDLLYSVSGSFSSIQNRIIRLGGGTQELEGGRANHHGDYVNYTREGFPLYSFFLIKTDGLFRSAEEVAAYSKDGVPIQPEARPGDIRFVDANSDGMITDADRVYCGSPFPDFDYGLWLDANWRFLDFSLFLQGTYGNKIYNGYRTYTESFKYNTNYSSSMLRSYTFDPTSEIPRLTVVDPNGNSTFNSDRFLEDGSYFRVKTITVGINMKEKWLGNIPFVEGARFYLDAQNLLTITPYSGYNSDIGGGGYDAWRGSLIARGIDWSVYPTARSFHAGFQLKF